MKIKRKWAMPNRWTFKIKPINELLCEYVGNGKGWIDPFAGMNSPAEFTNDLNSKMPTKYHLDAEEFCKTLRGKFNGVLIDPPYSYRQIKECYEGIGLKVAQQDTQSRFYNKVMNAICDKLKRNSYAISFGWNSNGFGKSRGFEIIEILLVAHGSHHNDTIMVVEQKIANIKKRRSAEVDGSPKLITKHNHMDEEKDLNEDQSSDEEGQADDAGEDSQKDSGAESSDASESGEEGNPDQE